MSQSPSQWPVLHPRAKGVWTARCGDRWGVLDPETGRVELVDPSTDRRLPGLAAALREGQLCGYRAGRRAIVAAPTSFIKVVRPERVDTLVRRHELLDSSEPSFAAPRVLGAASDGRVELSVMAGQSLHQRIRTDPTRPLADVGAVIAALHRHAIPRWLPVRQPDDPKSWVTVSRRRPTGHQATIERAATQLPELGARAEAVVHGDLHDKNIFCSPAHLSLIDLDGLALGAPEDDVGNLAVHLELRNLQARTGLAVGARTKSLYDGYGRVEPLDHERLRAVEAHTWFRLACLYQYRAASERLVPTLLRLATGQQR